MSMPRLINVYHTKHKNLIDNYYNVDISDINNIINYSSDIIKFNHLQLLDQSAAEQVLAVLINKLKLSGSLVLCLSNIKYIAKLYSDLALTDSKFLERIGFCRSIWSLEFLKDFIASHHKDTNITKIQQDNSEQLIYVTLERTQI